MNYRGIVERYLKSRKPQPYAQIFTAMDAFDGDRVALMKTLVKTYLPLYHIKKRPVRKAGSP